MDGKLEVIDGKQSAFWLQHPNDNVSLMLSVLNLFYIFTIGLVF